MAVTSNAKALSFTRRLRERMKDKDITQADVARALGIKQATVSLYFRDPDHLKTKGADFFTRFVQEHGFGKSEANEITKEFFAEEFRDIFGSPNNFEKYIVKDLEEDVVPVLASASAGTGDSDAIEEYARIPKIALKGRSKTNVFAVKVNGNCLVSHEVRFNPRNIAHGDYAFFDISQTPKNSDVVLYWDNREEKLIIKVFNERGKNIVLYDARGVMVPKPQFDNDLVFRGVVFWRSGGMTL
jgi:transcriptional regulator with XRE-family HTH domain